MVGELLDAASGRSVIMLTHQPEGLDLVDDVLSLTGGRLRPVLDGCVPARDRAGSLPAPRRSTHLGLTPLE